MAGKKYRVVRPASWPAEGEKFGINHAPDHRHLEGDVIDCLPESSVVCKCSPCEHAGACCGWLVSQGYVELASATAAAAAAPAVEA